MRGKGIDMYDLIPDLHESDKHLYFTGQKFWVGVIEGMYPSPPVPRRKTRCYYAADVYLYRGQKIFAMNPKTDDAELYTTFYKIPDSELIFIQ